MGFLTSENSVSANTAISHFFLHKGTGRELFSGKDSTNANGQYCSLKKIAQMPTGNKLFSETQEHWGNSVFLNCVSHTHTL